MSDLMRMLGRHGFEMDFFHAVELLENHFSSPAKTTDPLNSGAIQFVSDTGIAFPPGDIASITWDEEKQQARLTCSFLGLLGVSSPLPHYFTEFANKYAEDGLALTDFLNMFNHRMYVFFYRAWKKYCFITRSFESASVTMLDNLGHIAGLSTATLQKKKRLIAYAGLLSLPVRNGEGLRTMVSDFFDGVPIALQQWLPRWAPVRNLKRIGADTVLGKNTMLGTHILDVSGKFRISIGPLEQDIFKTFLPDTTNIKELQEIIRLYCTDPLDFDIEVKLKPTALTPVTLGKNDAPLGIILSCGVSQEQSEPYTIVIQNN